MLRRTLTLSAAALVAAFVGFGAARAMPITAASDPLPVLQTSQSANIQLAGYNGGRHYYPRGGGAHRGYGPGYGGAYYRGGRYWRPGVGVAVGSALAAPYYGSGHYGNNAHYCVNRNGRRYVCGYY